MHHARPTGAAALAAACLICAHAHAADSRPPTAASPIQNPRDDPADTTVWPNQISRANSDPWLAANHDKLVRMRPRVLLVNFSNEHDTAHLMRLANQIIDALRESSRYHGYSDPSAPAFLEYQIAKLVDLRDTDRRLGNSRNFPYKDQTKKTGFNTRYRAFFEDRFASHFAIADPKNPNRSLRLKQLVDGGYIHELWFFTSGSVAPGDPTDGAFEVIEKKPRYNDQFRRIGDEFVQAGNGGDDDEPWIGRSLRIGCINASRGPGCFLESLAHGVEGNSNARAIPYFTKYFEEYADFDLTKRFKLPFNSLYAVDYGNSPIQYPDPATMTITHGGTSITVKDYYVVGGSAHFPPNARGHYDLENKAPVLSCIETWRTQPGKSPQKLAKPWTIDSFAHYREMANDCMGPWLVYWRQNMPGLRNQQRDDRGRPMKNWWPFLFY